jgi:FkbM family methyltransferase
MKKRYLLLLIPIVFAIVLFVPKMVASPERRTQAFFAIERYGLGRWPVGVRWITSRILLTAAWPIAPVWYQVEPHIRMRLDPTDLGPLTILETGEYEPVSFAMVGEHLGAGATLIDVGANIGYYSLKAAPMVGAAGHVIAIEPNPEALQKMRVNLAASGANNVVTLAPVACSDTESTLDLYAAPGGNTGETSLSKANASQEGASTHTYKVRARPLDDIVREAGVTRVDAIKIDVEGAECQVLKGARQTLGRFHPMLLVEVADDGLRRMGSSAAQVRELLRAQGYREGRHDGLNVEFLPVTPLAASGH